MPETSALVTVLVDGLLLQAQPGTTVAALLLNHAIPARRSVTGEPRTALCGMGICFECRATVDGLAHRRTCQLPCRDGMVVETEAVSQPEPAR